jgi:hypothetical protein
MLATTDARQALCVSQDGLGVAAHLLTRMGSVGTRDGIANLFLHFPVPLFQG